MKSTAELRAEAEQRMKDRKAGIPAGRPRASPAASVADGSEVESLASLRSRVSERSRISGRTSEIAYTAASRSASQQSRKSLLENAASRKSEAGSDAAFKENRDPNIDLYEKVDGVYRRADKQEKDGLSESSRGQAHLIFVLQLYQIIDKFRH